MLRFVPHSEIEFNRWDACVRSSAEHLIYAYADYLEISTNGKWDAIIEFSDDAYVSVFPLPYKNLPGLKIAFQPIHSQQLGLFTTANSRHLNPAEYLAAILENYRKINLQLNTQNTAMLKNLPAGFQVAERINFHLDLNLPYPEISRHYAQRLKRNLKKAGTHAYKVSVSDNLPALIALFRQTRGKQLPEIKSRHYQLIEKQYTFLKKTGRAEIKEIRENGKLIAGGIFVNQPGKLIFLFSAQSETGRQTNAMSVLLDAIIRENAATSKILDFEGGSIENLRQFYSSFGAKPVTYLSVSKNNLPWYYKWLLT